MEFQRLDLQLHYQHECPLDPLNKCSFWQAVENLKGQTGQDITLLIALIFLYVQIFGTRLAKNASPGVPIRFTKVGYQLLLLVPVSKNLGWGR